MGMIRFLMRSAGLAMLVAIASSRGHALLIAQEPLFLTQSQAPLVMLNMARDHRLYYEAYNDYSDLNGDGALDLGYKPGQINYYGYFDSFKCYSYNSTDKRFDPVSVTADKRCGGLYWSGDFLNYVTTSRMDALRKVLYGGYRKTDTTTLTVLERVFIPQDAHSWGKEYLSVAHDGYDIADYTPLNVPAPGRRHFFTNVTLDANGNGDGSDDPPLMRVLQNSSLRIWNWVSIERPVAGAQCLFGTTRKDCVTGDTAAAGGWAVVPASAFTGLNASFYDISGTGITTVNSAADMSALKTGGTLLGTQPISRIDCDSQETYDVYDDITGATVTYNSDCNPLTPGISGGADERYFTEFNGSITVPSAGTYYFAIDGNNNVDLYIDGNLVKAWYGNHNFSSCRTSGDFDSPACNSDSVGSIALSAGTHTIRFRHHEHQVNDGYRLWWKLGTQAVSRQDYVVRAKVCDITVGLEPNCTSYTDGTTVTYKPTGLLHNYGANNGMYFGLLSGSYKNNLQGGVLRKNISSFTNEFSPTTGILTSSPSNGGIIDTINRFRITSFAYGSQSYSCGWITTRAINNGECEMWGNPLGEMVWETLRYLNGKTSPTSTFNYSTGSDVNLGLPKPSWWDPYSAEASRTPSAAFPYCAKPYIMAISDSYPSFDSDSVPGSTFGGVTSDLSITGPNVKTLGDTMWATEYGGTRNVFIGQSGATSDSAPTAKSVSSFGDIRGLAPSDPTRQGSYSSAELAYWARTTDLRGDKAGEQKTGFYSVALAPPLPTIEIPIPSTTDKITIVPFAKSVGGSSISATTGAFQPTNQIVDFYVDTIKNTDASNADPAINGGRPYYRFRINYEDVEQGADHDMDAIAVYDIWLNSDNSISINVVSEYAAGGIMQHMGYIISGTSADGTYLVVRDVDTAAASDPNYFLDTPNVAGALPLTFSSAVTIGTPCVNSASNYACRTFTPSTGSSSAILLKDPLWYAAKWGGFKDDNANNIPDTTEWDADGDGVPDNYFLVVNPLKLEQQMAAALAKIASDSGTAAALATNSTSLRTDLVLYQARFSSDGWGGELNAYPIKSDGTLDAPAWQAQFIMAGVPTSSTRIDANSRVVLTYDPDVATATSRGIPFRWSNMTSSGVLQSSLNKAWNTSGGATDGKGEDRIDFLRGGAVSGFRTRPCITGTSGSTCITNYLGDIVNSSIQFVGAPAFGYVLPYYADYYNDRKSRTKMVYAGGNDGMLHGFDADTGIEKLAYIPSMLYRNARLSKLTASDYGKTSNPHAYYVDGTPTVGDVCQGSCAGANDWRTILVGGLGAGGQGLYALDISRPEDFSEANAASLVLWEYKDSDNSDLGYTFSRPAIVRLCTSRNASSTSVPKTCTSSQWVVVFGGGYNNTETDGSVSATGQAALFVLDAITGTLLRKINYTGGGTPNGFANFSPADVDGDGVVDYAYAGDLFGNMVKFDLDTASGGTVAYTLYTATTTSSVTQPITSAPELYAHPRGGIMVLFGTGKYLEVTDKTDSQQQTFYGIWDNGGNVPTSATRSNLQAQYLVSDSISADGVIFSTTTRNAVDWDTKKGWYLDLSVSGTNPSERVAYDPQILGTVLNFVSVVPSTDVCAYGGDSWDYLLDPVTGASLDYSAFTGVPAITTAYGQLFASRRKSGVGISPTGTTITVGRGSGYDFKGGSTGQIERFGVTLKAAAGARLSWREISTD
ncbi:MAG: hypothetical protein K8F32_04260 [Rhodocyclaceae bacterium]|nr:hypothetical protein [Rhodocyclaceae bacterium]GIK25336.1 MAG: hypothetical protein BroJett006_15820 [Betaproteobacteria bacterium]